MTVTIENSEAAIKNAVEGIEQAVRAEVKSRAVTVSEYMKTASVEVLSGKRHGRPRTYHGRHYIASAPGEAPAQRSGALSHSFKPETIISESGRTMMIHSRVSSSLSYAGKLETGWGRIEPRPYGNRIYDKGVIRAMNEFRRPYL